MFIVGAHYLTFISLYGMWLYGALAGALVVTGASAIFVIPALRELSGWVGVGILLVFAVLLFVSHRAEGGRLR